MESPLSFDSSENFRKKLLVRNLKPYGVDQVFTSSDIPGVSDITLIDYSVIDSPSIEVIGQNQEEVLYNQNQYGPNNGNEIYGNTVSINLNLNTQTNQGIYDFSKSIGSKLELQGQNQETLLYVNNLYGPANQTSYGDSVNINQNFQSNTNIGEYDITDTIGGKLEVAGNQQEIILYTNNQYGPQGTNSYGNTVDINQNLQTLTNSGEYDVSDSIGSKLETIGNFQEIILYTNNIYGPANQISYGDSVNINQNLQSTSNNGEYGPIVWSLQRTSEQSRNIFYVLNEFGPDGTNGYGDQINDILDSNLQTSSNQGEYQTSTGVYGNNLTLTLTVPKLPNQSRTDLYVINEYGPSGIDGYGEDVNPIIYTDLISQSNQGEYNTTTGVYGDNLTQTLTDNKTPNQSRTQSFIKNEYGPDNGFGEDINPIIDINLQTTTNVGIYNETVGIYGDNLSQTLTVTKTPEQSQNEAYGDNKYVSGEGLYEVATITDVTDIIERTFLPYAESTTTFIFVPSQYTPYSILLQNDPQGSDGSLSQDSSLAQLGAERLQTEFKARVALELLQQTVNRVNAFNTSLNTDTGNVSVKPNTDPFNAIGIASGNIPLFARDFSITRPDLFLGQGINFAAKLAGLYSPYSYIPGEYFDYPKKRLVNQLIENPIALGVNSVLGAINKLTSLNIENGSELFLANTSNATSDLLFQQIYYNTYRPDYRLNSLRDPNFLAPKPSFYIGDRKTFLKGITPIELQPLNRFGDNTEAAVLGHGQIGVDYETYKGQSVDEKFFFGLTTKGYYDGANDPNGTDSGTIFGGFTWGSSDTNTLNKKVGYSNSVIGEVDGSVGLESTLAGNYNSFRPDSILDVTNQLVIKADQASGVFKQRHVGNAINQVTKVFNDGNIELTKGSRVIKYSTPTSVGSTNPNDVAGFEYCRVFTKDNPYYRYSDLQKTDGNIRNFQNSVLSNTYNLNIAPTTDNGSTTIDKANKKVKKYMFSLENLAWRTSNRKGFTVEDLPIAERGPNNGRIMWFPPYGLTFSEDTKTSWTDHTFLGRTEPVYTYGNTSRSGSISWKILVDHPSILNVIVNKELEKTAPESKLTKVVDSFFAGCTKYDIYELLKKFTQFTISDVFDVLTTTGNIDTFKKATEDLPTQTPQATVGGGNEKITEFEKSAALFFDHAIPKTESDNYETLYINYISRIENAYKTQAENFITKYSNVTIEDASGATLLANTNFFETYVDATINGINDFKNFIQEKFNKFKTLIDEIETFLNQSKGNKLELELVGGASSTGTDSGNAALSDRRIKSVINYLETTKLKTFIDNKQLTFKKTPSSSSIKITETEKNYNQIDCSKKFEGKDADKTVGIYSVNAMACRRVGIGKINQISGDETAETKTETNSVIAEPNAATNEAPNSTLNNGQINNNQNNVKPQLRQDIVKRLLRKLLTESDYFEMIKENDSILYNGIKEKIKHFNPAFHSITPEGLNSRLTFLQQCMRPGDTIPTVQKGDGGQTTLVYGDAFNSAFGAPPVCVLRVGDFFHTKIVIDSLNIKYEDAPFDLNPEGIGVQPMIADVTINFNFIGGQGLAKPIQQLQNALSFNYYANTEVYDERAEETEPVSEELTKELLDQAQDSLGILTDLTRPTDDNGQTTIGTILNQTANPNTNTITGEIQYKDVFGELVENTKNYMTSTFNAIDKINTDLLYGGIVLSTANVKYREGEIITTGSTNGRIFGSPTELQPKIDDLFSKTKKDVDNDLCPLLYLVNEQNFKNSDIRDVKRKIKDMIDDRKSKYLQTITNAYTDTLKNELKLVNLIDKLNYVSGSKDGYKNKKNTPIIYNLSGKTDVVENVYLNTLDEYKGDYAKIANDMETFYNGLFFIIPPSGVESYNEDYTFDLYLEIENKANIPSENRFFMIFGKEIIDDTQKILDALNSAVKDSSDKQKWENYFQSLGILPLKIRYENAKKQSEIFFDVYKNSTFYQKVIGTYQTNLKSKERVMLYQKQDPTNQNDGNNLVKLYQTVSIPDDKFNFKKEFKN